MITATDNHPAGIPCDSITIGERTRKDMGDLQGLADSIHELGLLQPIGVTSDNTLVFGQRRLLACRDILEWETIPARTVELDRIVLGEFAENEVRKDFTPSERVAILEAIEASIGNRQGQRTDLEPLQNIAEVAQETRDAAAKRAGFGNRETARQAKKVVEDGVLELVEAVDSGEVSVSAAAEVAELPPPMQRDIVAAGPKEVQQVAKARRKQKTVDAVLNQSPEELERLAEYSRVRLLASMSDEWGLVATDDQRAESARVLADRIIFEKHAEHYYKHVEVLSRLRTLGEGLVAVLNEIDKEKAS